MRRLFSNGRKYTLIQKQDSLTIDCHEQGPRPPSVLDICASFVYDEPVYDEPPFLGAAETDELSRSKLSGGTLLSRLQLIPLSSARSRTDIRRRREGFEMEHDPPFAVQTQRLISLEEAQGRDDIRRRREAFETVAPRDSLQIDTSKSTPRMGPTDGSIFFTAAASEPSVYSLRISLDGSTRSATLEDSFREVAEIRKALAEAAAGSAHSSEADESPNSSFDEESFLRMAASLRLGW
ncbi:hypothetical protein OBBRIDRAFT_832709 [Obba rivulosa]|uniref:Uncharacterized protein n=1 Tax=Obba rivulosa TaxID=1052685 RepID=A0A8E2DPE8_9APHY|nr:hypothetical protein OBBRIDRAFT_832709 [Obba rivulosa]